MYPHYLYTRGLYTLRLDRDGFSISFRGWQRYLQKVAKIARGLRKNCAPSPPSPPPDALRGWHWGPRHFPESASDTRGLYSLYTRGLCSQYTGILEDYTPCWSVNRIVEVFFNQFRSLHIRDG